MMLSFVALIPVDDSLSQKRETNVLPGAGEEERQLGDVGGL